jgi:hypothetical protein
VRAPRVLAAAVIPAVLGAASTARADPPDPTTGLVAGAAVLVASFTVGATFLATAEGDNGPSNAGWMIMQSGFALAPLAAHGVLGEWGRGLAFSALPTATTAGTLALFEAQPGTILHGSLPQQRFLWGLFGVGLASSVVGIVDATLAAPRIGPVAIAPAIGPGHLGIELGGSL